MAAVLILAGIQMLGIGLLGELQVRHFHDPSHRAPYAIDRYPAAAVERREFAAVGAGMLRFGPALTSSPGWSPAPLYAAALIADYSSESRMVVWPGSLIVTGIILLLMYLRSRH